VLPRLVRLSAYAHALTRVLIGASFLAAPDRTVRPWIGPTYDTPGGRVALRAFAIRDVLIGGAQLSALRRGTGARSLFRWGVLAEAVDVPAALVEQQAGGATRPEIMNAAGWMGLVGGLFLAVALPDD
jgi:hypothetical protein